MARTAKRMIVVLCMHRKRERVGRKLREGSGTSRGGCDTRVEDFQGLRGLVNVAPGLVREEPQQCQRSLFAQPAHCVDDANIMTQNGGVTLARAREIDLYVELS